MKGIIKWTCSKTQCIVKILSNYQSAIWRADEKLYSIKRISWSKNRQVLIGGPVKHC